jgi:epoxyqueuosine reductase
LTLTQNIKQIAINSGLDLVGIAPADPFEDYRWQDSAMRDPRLTMTDARSLVVVGVSELRFLKETKMNRLIGKVARSYAAGHECNLVAELNPIKHYLEGQGFKANISPGSIAQSTIPLKLTAIRAGLGWQGKHSVVITREFGSWVTFGGLLTTAVLNYDAPMIHDGCGKCTRCMDACPTEAIKAPYIIDMSLCLDEILNTPGQIPDEIESKIGNRILSCDTCLKVCPYSAKALKRIQMSGSNPYQFDLLELVNLNERQFQERFGKLNWSIDFDTFKRNVLIAIGNGTNKSSGKGADMLRVNLCT